MATPTGPGAPLAASSAKPPDGALMTSISSVLPAARQIADEVASWPGIEAGYGRRGELAFRYNRREIGHLHGDRAAHFSFPREVWHELRAAGRIAEHPVFPGRVGPAARLIETQADIEDVIALLALNYERLAGASAARPGPR